MSMNLEQVYIDNPVTVIGNNDLFYIVVNQTTDGAILGSSVKAIFSPIAGSSSLVTVGTITTGIWNGTTISGQYGGTGVNNGASTITIGGNTSFTGLYTFNGNLTGNTNVTFPTSGTLATTSEVPSLPLSLANGGTNAALTANNGGIFYSTASAGAILAGTATANQILLSGSSTTPAWSTATYPATSTINQLLYSSSNNVITGLSTSASAVLTTVASVPTWASELSLALGGTNANLTASAGGIVYSTSTAFAVLAGTATGNQLLTSGATAAPSWTTATYPATTTVNQLLYSSSANTVVGLATANSSVLVTSAGGVPSLSTTLPIGVQTNITELGTVTVGVWNASVIPLAYGGTNANLTANNGGIVWSDTTKLNILNGTATANQMLQSGATATPSWSSSTWPATTTINQLLYSSSANTVAGLATANSSVLVTSAGGVPSLSTTLPSGLTIPGYQTSLTLPLSLANGGTNASLTASNGGIFYSTASAGAILAGTSTAQQLLMSGASTTPIWSTSTYPTTNAINTLLYASSANVMAALATVNSAGLLTNGSGVPAWVAYTGTGAPVLNTSPKIITSILDTNGNVIIGFGPVASAVNYVQLQNGATTNAVSVGAIGSDSNIVLSIAGKGTSGAQIQGKSNAGANSAGFIGEFVSNVISSGSAVSLMTTTAKDVTSISLTAGDWDVWGNIFLNDNATTILVLYGWISATSATVPDVSLVNGYYGGLLNFLGFSVPYNRINVSTTTTVYLSTYANFASGTVTACGGIYARRAG